MLEDCGAFFERNLRPAGAWKAGLARWAEMAIARASELETSQPGEHGALVDAAQHMHLHLSETTPSGASDARELVITLSRFLTATAQSLREFVISSHEAQAYAAALGVEHAAQQVLAAIEGDFGHTRLG